MRAIITGLALLSASLMHSQKPIVSSNPIIEKKWIKNQSYNMDWYMVKDSSTVKIGQVCTEVIKNSKTIIIVTNVRFSHAKAPWVDSTIADLNTLKPIRHSSTNSQREIVINYINNTVNGYYYNKLEHKYHLLIDTVNDSFFDSNIYPTLLGWLPLKDGFTQSLTIYDFDPDKKSGLLKAQISGVNSGTYSSIKSGKREVWILTVSDKISNGKHIYYFDKSTRNLWRHEIYLDKQNMLLVLSE